MLEDRLEELYGKPALLFNSGYHASVGITSALAVPGTLFVCDKAIHASVIDGPAVGKADFRRFPTTTWSVRKPSFPATPRTTAA